MIAYQLKAGQVRSPFVLTEHISSHFILLAILILVFIFSLVKCAEYGSIIPPVVAVPYGKTIVLTCISAGRAVWFFGKNGDPVVGATFLSNSMYLPKAKHKHQGIYRCNGIYPNSTLFTAHSSVYAGSKFKGHLVLFFSRLKWP